MCQIHLPPGQPHSLCRSPRNEVFSIPHKHSLHVDFPVVLEQDETGAFIAYVPTMPGCHSFGDTREEALKNIREAIELVLETDGPPHSSFLGVETVHVGS